MTDGWEHQGTAEQIQRLRVARISLLANGRTREARALKQRIEQLERQAGSDRLESLVHKLRYGEAVQEMVLEAECLDCRQVVSLAVEELPAGAVVCADCTSAASVRAISGGHPGLGKRS